MMEHLVESHMGGYYISNKDADLIESYCEECNDADTILTSWNTEDKNGRVNALLKFFLMDNIKTKQDLYNRALENLADSYFHGIDLVYSLLNEIGCNIEEAYNIASELYEKNSLSEEEFNRIIYILNLEEERQINMVKYFEDEMFTIDSDTGLRVLKL